MIWRAGLLQEDRGSYLCAARILLALIAFFAHQSHAWDLYHAPEMSLYRMMRRVGTVSDRLSVPEFVTRVESEAPFFNIKKLDAGEKKATPPVNGNNQTDDEIEFRQFRQVVACSDGKLPTTKSALPMELLREQPLFDRLDSIYHGISHEETRGFRYMDRGKDKPYEPEAEKALVSVLRNSLDAAGFELLTKRDLDLCEALNAGYLLRLSISPDVSKCDPNIAKELYPERFNDEGDTSEEFPFEGRILLYRRGYSLEVSQGRLLLPKLDYLQASIVQRSARKITQALGRVEREIVKALTTAARSLQDAARTFVADFDKGMPDTPLSNFLRDNHLGIKMKDSSGVQDGEAKQSEKGSKKGFLRLDRYGGGKTSRFMGSPNMDNALDPFLAYDESEDFDNALDGERLYAMNGNFSAGAFTCEYDERNRAFSNNKKNPTILLERVSLNNIVDLASQEGRRALIKRFFSESQLVEPTYEEVVAIWRPLPDKPKRKRKLQFPKFVYDVAEIFEIEDKLPEFEEPVIPPPPPIEIRAFDDVPMANVPAVLPRTKLVFRPADAFVFDLITIVSFLAVFGSARFDNPRLDVFAIVTGTFWIIRTVIRYSNKLAQYELLVKKFLTSKISHRNAGALKYIARDAGTQRATRNSLVHLWLTQRMKTSATGRITRQSLLDEGAACVNDLLKSDRLIRVDVDDALKDLADLDLIGFDEYQWELLYVKTGQNVTETLKKTWNKIFDRDCDLQVLFENRARDPSIHNSI